MHIMIDRFLLCADDSPLFAGRTALFPFTLKMAEQIFQATRRFMLNEMKTENFRM